MKQLNGIMKNNIAHILLNIDDNHLAESETWVQKAVEAHKANGMMFNLAQDYYLYHEILKKKGDTEKAKEYLNKAIEQFRECGADGWV